ncbi:UdgX family uracil-DNA binding protein (plasmid) [Ensifer adhaerens]|nr:UdgX family uracil-DNA binding protein [Ensifer adhaerens]UAY05827.1 UdgX family uracil-DNA binding protein [Ensifer adhaerens]UAY13204.1 UdgX family uracil-DNA binding protein [Ensifer adhaerens]
MGAPNGKVRRVQTGPALSHEHAHGRSLSVIEREAHGCQRCDLYRNATQLVFGEGPPDARLVLVGEQPGDKEDVAGRPFVGPAGTVLTECLGEAGIERADCYLTNAVKHFKYEQRGKRRLHSRPNAGEIQRCAWWLGAELEHIHPHVVVALGATAARTLLGPGVKVRTDRGKAIDLGLGFWILVTIHPSYLLRIRGRESAERERSDFISDLKVALELQRA